jgi:hypothetical protein
MKTIIATLIALSTLAGIAAPANATELDAKTFFERIDRANYAMDAKTWFDQLDRDRH